MKKNSAEMEQYPSKRKLIHTEEISLITKEGDGRNANNDPVVSPLMHLPKEVTLIKT